MKYSLSIGKPYHFSVQSNTHTHTHHIFMNIRRCMYICPYEYTPTFCISYHTKKIVIYYYKSLKHTLEVIKENNNKF